jgi:hypothetical protein
MSHGAGSPPPGLNQHSERPVDSATGCPYRSTILDHFGLSLITGSGLDAKGIEQLMTRNCFARFVRALAGFAVGVAVCGSCSEQACDAVARSPILIVRMTAPPSESQEQLEACLDDVCSPLLKSLPPGLVPDEFARSAVLNELLPGVSVKVVLRRSGGSSTGQSTSVIPKQQKLGGCKGWVTADVTLDATTGELTPSKKLG